MEQLPGISEFYIEIRIDFIRYKFQKNDIKTLYSFASSADSYITHKFWRIVVI